MRFTILTSTTLAILAVLNSCALITVPVEIVGKTTTTTIGLVGKAAGAGIDAMVDDDEDEKKSKDENENDDE